MKKYTRIKVHYAKPTEHAKSMGVKAGDIIAEFIYKTDSHALALHQCGKDNPSYDDRIVLEAITIDIDDEANKEIYKAFESAEQIFTVNGWD